MFLISGSIKDIESFIRDHFEFLSDTDFNSLTERLELLKIDNVIKKEEVNRKRILSRGLSDEELELCVSKAAQERHFHDR